MHTMIDALPRSVVLSWDTAFVKATAMSRFKMLLALLWQALLRCPSTPIALGFGVFLGFGSLSVAWSHLSHRARRGDADEAGQGSIGSTEEVPLQLSDSPRVHEPESDESGHCAAGGR